MSAYVKTAAPHIRDTSSVPKIFWIRAAALVPSAGILFYLQGPGFAAASAAAAAGALAAQVLGSRLFGIKAGFYRGDTVASAWLFAVMTAAPAPAWAFFTAAFTAFLLGREFFGGAGAHPFHPAVLALLLLESGPFQAGAESGPLILTGALILSGLWLVQQKQLTLELPLIFGCAAALACGWGAGRDFLSAPAAAAAGFFLLSDPGTLPMTRTGRRIFAALTGLLGGVLAFHLTDKQAVAVSFLTGQACVPWLDILIRPKGSR